MKNLLSKAWEGWNRISLVKQIITGLVVGVILALGCPHVSFIAIFGKLFVGLLKAIAPLLVFLLVTSSLALQDKQHETKMKDIIILYVVSMLLAGALAVTASFTFQPTLVLNAAQSDVTPPSSTTEVVYSLFLSCAQNPVEALTDANYIGILFWAIVFGIALNHASDTTKKVIDEIAQAINRVIAWVIRCAPLGVMGLIFVAIADGGLSVLLTYAKVLLVLVGTMLATALVLNPILVFIKIKRNPYPLVWRCLKDSGLTAFFTRSSAANIPVNMAICEELNLDKATYSISIPLGATINMCGASITITILTLAAVHTLNIPVSMMSALLMCIIATVSACGSSGVAGGSLMLIPLACAMFGIPNDISMQVVGTGFIIGVVQDSCETALNSSSDLLFTAAAELAKIPREEAVI